MLPFSFLYRFPDDDACWTFLERVLWPTGPACPTCDNVGDAAPWKPRRHRWQCRACGKQFHVVQETALAGTHISMHTWFTAIYLRAKYPRLSSAELSRQLGIRERTVSSMRSRIDRMLIEDKSLIVKILEAAEDYTG